MIKNDKGQSTIEFILTFSFAIGFLVVFIYLAINMTTGFVLHYATFMSSRVFLSRDNGSNDPESVLNNAEEMARSTFNSYQLNKFGVKSSDLKFNVPGRVNNGLYIGATARFKKPISPLKNIGGGVDAIYLSESFLGKEPMQTECFQQVCAAMGLSSCSTQFDVTLFDNGC